MHILFCWTNQKNVLEKGMKDWTFKVYLLTGELSSWFRLVESLKITCAKPYAWFLKYLSKGRGLDYFLQIVLPKLSKTSDLSLKWTSRVNFDVSRVSRMTINFELLKVSKMTSLKIYVSSYGEARNIKFGHQVNLIQRVQLGPLPQGVVTSLPDNNVTLTNFFISSYRGITVIKRG